MKRRDASTDANVRRANARRTALILGIVVVAIFVFYIFKTMLH